MTGLKKEPPESVRSLEELFAIAAAMEDEAATRYAELAVTLRSDANPELADVFERLSRDERGHLDSVVDWSVRKSGMAPDPARIRWSIPETFDDENIGVTDPKLLSAYRALAMAVRNEERAFTFWTYVAAHAPASEIAQAAEALAREELEHVATLRRERRRAYRLPSAARAARAGQSLRDSAELERILASLIEARAEEAGADDARRLRELAAISTANAAIAIRPPAGSVAAAQTEAVLGDPVALAELLVDLYLEAADREGEEEEKIADLHRLASGAIHRLSWLRADLPEVAANA